MIKLLIGGSPCTRWSIAQSKNRETKAEGMGWELFLNYVIAKEKFNPDLFLYENNWSASNNIKKQIEEELECKLMRINSNLVSAQNRDRFYVFNWDVEQPANRNIFLNDIIENEYILKESGYLLDPNNINKIFTKNPNEPIRIGAIENNAKNQSKYNSKQYRVYSIDGKSVTICGQGGGVGAKTGLYAIPIKISNLKEKNIYKVENYSVLIDEKQIPINLRNGNYIIRKLTPTECERLQTMPDGYTSSVSDAQRYKGLGNGWTAEVIIHILHGALKNTPKNEKIVVFSMYDGIGTGRYCLDKMGFTNVEYHAYEIDKYAIKVAMSNYPDIIQHGDAFQVREEKWRI